VVTGTLRYWNKKLPQPNLIPYDDEEEAGLEMVGPVREAYQDSLLTRDLSRIAKEEFPRMAVAVRNLARRLGSGLERRYRSDRQRRLLDLKGSIRLSLSSGGVPFRLKYRSRRRTKPRLVLLGDISGSMVKYAAFVFEFLIGLSRAVPRMEFYLFAEGAERVTELVREHLPLEATVEKLTGGKQWGGSTDLASALRFLAAGGDVSRDAILVVISDGKTRNREEAAGLLLGIRSRLRDSLWLNPLPRDQWGRGVEDLARTCRMFECRNLAQLEKVMRRWLGPGRHHRPRPA
jgi:uncharacterized protein with von Willebrand factor type A (vWA) domain